MAKKTKRKKNLIRSSLSGKIINGKDVIMVTEAEEYIKKMGKEVIPFNKLMVNSLLTVLGMVFLFPIISASGPSIFIVDFSATINQVIFGALFVLSLFLYIKSMKLWSGFIMTLIGMFFAFNEVNIIISLVLVAFGVVIISQQD